MTDSGPPKLDTMSDNNDSVGSLYNSEVEPSPFSQVGNVD